MSQTLAAIKLLISQHKIRVSDHGLEELRADGLRLSDILESAAFAELVEEYPEAFKGPTVLTLHRTHSAVIHVVWGLAHSNAGVATLVTAYTPDLKKWYTDFKYRRPT